MQPMVPSLNLIIAIICFKIKNISPKMIIIYSLEDLEGNTELMIKVDDHSNYFPIRNNFKSNHAKN